MSLSSRNIPDFSVVIPTFNRCNFLKKAIKSVLRQKYVSFEIIVSDNCSTDNTEGVIRAIDDKRIKYFKNTKNIGFPMNVRKCFKKASGKYIFTLSDDDLILDENTLSGVLKVMKKYKVGMANIGAIYWSKSPKYPCKIFNLSNKLIVLKPEQEKHMVLRALELNYAFYSGLIFDIRVIDINKVIESYTYSFYPLIFDTAKEHGFAYIPNYFIVARVSLRFVPHYYSLDRLGSFFTEDYLNLLKQFLHGKDFEKHKKQYILDSIFNLPSIKLFSNNKNYIKILRKTVGLKKSLLVYPKFYVFVVIGFLPKIVLKLLRKIMIYYYEKKSIIQVEKYDYFRKLQNLGTL